MSKTADFVLQLAAKHRVKYVRTNSDALAEVITRLSGDEVIFDEIQNLLLALNRAGVIDSNEMVNLFSAYLDEMY